MPSRVGLLLLLLVAVACASPGVSAPAPSPAASPQPAIATNAPAPAVATPGPTVLPTLPPGAAATSLPAESPWAHANAAELAHALAARVAEAANDQPRQTALLEIMRALNIGVYTPDGVAVLHGAERGPHDFYLYDFELAMMAASLDRKDAWTIADIAAALDQMGIRSDNQPLSEAQFAPVLLAAVRDASQAPADHSSLPLLLARELGLRQPTAYDLLDNPKTDAVAFSALQRFLITIDAVLPIVREAKLAAAPSQLVAQSNGVLQLKPASQSSVCDSMVATAIREDWGAGKLFLGLTTSLLKKFNPATLALVVIDALHGEMLAFSVAVQALPDPRETHYGHETPGAELQVRIIVAMRDQLPELLIKCGWLLGVEFPKKGPIAGVTMLWFTDGLEDHGQVICEADCKKTGADGIANLRFKPKNEAPLYGWGPEHRDMRFVTGIALYQSRHKNYLGAVAQMLTPKAAGGPVVISYHAQPDLELHFDSAIDGTSKGFWLSTNAHARVRLKQDAALGWTGKGDMNFDIAPKAQTTKCENKWNANSGTTSFHVFNGQFGSVQALNPDIPVQPGASNDAYTVYEPKYPNCIKPMGPFPNNIWPGIWAMGHVALFDMSRGGYRLYDWQMLQSGPIFESGPVARKVMKGNCVGNCTETTTLELSILPAPPAEKP